MTIRFIVGEHHVRDVKNNISRDMLAGFDENGIGIASATYDIVGFPPLRIENAPSGNGQTPKTEKTFDSESK